MICYFWSVHLMVSLLSHNKAVEEFEITHYTLFH